MLNSILATTWITSITIGSRLRLSVNYQSTNFAIYQVTALPVLYGAGANTSYRIGISYVTSPLGGPPSTVSYK